MAFNMTTPTAIGIHIALLPVHGLVIILGVIGNSLVITIVRKTPSMYTTTNFLLSNLALADLLTLIWLVPTDASKFLPHPDGISGDFVCRFLTYSSIPKLTAAVSGMTLTVISVERYHALLKPLRTGLRLTRDNVMYAIAAIWLVCLALLLPFVFVVRFDVSSSSCVEDWGSNIARNVFNFLLGAIMFTSLATVCFCYFNLIRGLHYSKLIIAETVPAQEDARSKRKVLNKLLFIVTVSFLVCFVPYTVAFIRYAATGAYEPNVYDVMLTILYCNSCVNPVVCAFQSANYRRGFRQFLCGWRGAKVRPGHSVWFTVAGNTTVQVSPITDCRNSVVKARRTGRGNPAIMGSVANGAEAHNAGTNSPLNKLDTLV